MINLDFSESLKYSSPTFGINTNFPNKLTLSIDDTFKEDQKV